MLAYLAPGLAIRLNQLRVYPWVDWAVVSCCLLTAPIPVGSTESAGACCSIHVLGWRAVRVGWYSSLCGRSYRGRLLLACSRPAPAVLVLSERGCTLQKPRRPAVWFALLARCIPETGYVVFLDDGIVFFFGIFFLFF